MRIYQPGTTGKRTMLVQPGNEFPNSEWMEGDKPRMFQVPFSQGEAEVDDQLGQYLIDKGMASRSPIIVPQARIDRR